jgi:8-amino-7-oxononanoate synthase
MDIFNKCFKYQEAKQVKASGFYPYFRAIHGTQGSEVTLQDGHRCIMIGSNNYLGLTHDPRVQKAAKDAIDRFGTGCTGSRFLNGNLELHESLETRLAKFLNKEACLVFSTGFGANHGTISCIAGRNDVIYSDRENHASILEGLQSSLAETVKFKHNDMADLERVLKATRQHYEGAIIIADGIFSMSGDIFKLPEAVALAKKFECRMYIDDAHALGVLGEKGEGTAAHYNLVDSVDLLVGTFSKSFGSIGGYVAGEADVIDYIKHRCRPFIFTAALPPAATATVLECLRIVENEPEHLQRLWKNTHKMQHGFKSLGFNTLKSQTPIIPIFVGDDAIAFQFTKALYEEGVFVTPVVRPAVAQGFALIRTSYMASHTEQELDRCLEVFEMVGKRFQIIGNQAMRLNTKRANFGT